MKNKPLRVNEIFYSIQGEGFWTGTPMVFVRLSGCNLRCPFCDTDHSRFTLMTPTQIADAVLRYPARRVVITGGEPSLQPLEPLVDLLHSHGITIHIETNGTNPLPDTIDWVTCSPKAGGDVSIQRMDELKLVYQGDDMQHYLSQYPGVTRFYLQPLSGQNIPQTLRYVLDHPEWNLSLQTHKFIDIP